jgi:L-alanine-DL-glutamate epimerase-like enolase superfamily enzyme
VCVLPVERPFDVGGTLLTERDYLIVRLAAVDGCEGVAYCLGRGGSFGSAVQAVAAELFAAPGPVPREDPTSAEVRVRSLVDICMWDIDARRAGVPVWSMLATGPPPETVPVLLVEGYAIPGEDDARFAARLAARVAAGASRIKLRDLPGAESTATRLAATRKAVGWDVDLVVDAGWRWTDVGTAAAAVEAWRPYNLAWVEDPFPAGQGRLTAELRAASHAPIGAGDEFDRAAIADLLACDAVDVLRVDATTVGGLTGFRSICEAVGGRVPISPHVGAEIHQHCAFADRSVSPLEVFAPDRQFDASCAFVSPTSLLWSASNAISAPSGPGLSLEIDWAVVEENTVWHAVFGP